MPSNQPLPTIARLRQVGRNGLRGERDIYGDTHAGAIYEHIGWGPMAVLLYRESDADRDNFRSIYWDDADGDDLTWLIQGRTGGGNPFSSSAIARVLDTHGQGICLFQRSTAAFGSDEFLAGSRIQLGNGQASTNQKQIYRVTEDTAVGALQTSARVSVEAVATGPGTACSANNSIAGQLQLLDVAGDPLWKPVSLVCADGTSFESADDYRARVRSTLLLNRNGYLDKMLRAVNAAGATYMIAFESQRGLPAGLFTDDDFELPIMTIAQAYGGTTTTIVTGSGGIPIPHGLKTGQLVTLAGIPGYVLPTINRTWPITVVGPTSFSIAQLFSGILSGGTVTGGGQADYGLNAVYVADQNYASTSALVNKCTIALEAVRGLGADLWVGGIQTSALAVSALVTLNDSPANLDVIPISRAIAQALLGYFGPSNKGYIYKLNALAGVMRASHPAIQTVSIPYQWLAETNYSYGQLVFAPGAPSVIYRCTQAGTSGIVQPTFPSSYGSSAPDGSAIWTALANQNFGLFAGGVIQTADPTISPNAPPRTLTRYTLAPGAISIAYAPPI